MEANPPSQVSTTEIKYKNNKTTPSNKLLLKSAWTRHDVYSDNAKAAQNRFLQVREWIIGLNVVAVFLAVSYAELSKFHIEFLDKGQNLISLTKNLERLTGFCLILIPIVISALLAFAVKFDKGNNWVLLRGSAEALKMEIFYYRTQVGEYVSNRDGVLARKIKLISERLKGSAVHQTALSPYEEEQSLSWKSGWVIDRARYIGQCLGKLGKRLKRFFFGGRNEPTEREKVSYLNSMVCNLGSVHHSPPTRDPALRPT